MNYQDTEHHKVNYTWLLIIEFARLIIKKQKQTKKKTDKNVTSPYNYYLS